MAEDITIHGKVVVDMGNTMKSTEDYKNEIKALQKQMETLTIGSDEYMKAQEQLTKTTGEMNTAVAKSGGTFGNLKSALGGMVPGFEGASEGASGLGKQLLILAANPIVLVITAIVGALTLLYKAFASTNDGADKMEQIFAGIGAAIDVLRDRVLKVGEAILKFFKGDFSGAMADARSSVSGIGQEIADEFAAAANATKVMQDLEDSMRFLAVSRAELNRDLAKAKETMADADATFAERRAALNTVRAKESEQNKKELAQARAEYEAQIKLNSLSDTSDEDLDKATQLKVKMISLEESSATQLRSLNRMDRQLRREAQAKADAEDKEREERIKKANEKKEKDFEQYLKREQDKLAAAKAEQDMIVQGAAEVQKLVDDERAKKIAADNDDKKRIADKMVWEVEMTKFNTEAKKRIADEELAHKKAVAAEGNAIIENAINVFGKQSMVGKGLAIAQALINTYAGASEALRAKSVLPQPFDVISRIAAVASVLATGFKTVKAITSVNVPSVGGGGGGGGSTPSVDVSAPVAPRQNSTSLDSASIQGVGNAALGGVNRTFVLDADIQNNQERAARLNRAARLG